MPIFDETDENVFDNSDGKKQYNRANIPDGKYTVEVELAEAGENKAGDYIKWRLVVIGDQNGVKDGTRIEKMEFLGHAGDDDPKKRESRNKKLRDFKVDLNTVGFDVASWPKGSMVTLTPIALQIAKGCHLLVAVKKNDSFLNVYINKRVTGKDGKPEKFTIEDMQTLANFDFGASGLSSGKKAEEKSAEPPAKAPTPAGTDAWN